MLEEEKEDEGNTILRGSNYILLYKSNLPDKYLNQILKFLRDLLDDGGLYALMLDNPKVDEWINAWKNIDTDKPNSTEFISWDEKTGKKLSQALKKKVGPFYEKIQKKFYEEYEEGLYDELYESSSDIYLEIRIGLKTKVICITYDSDDDADYCEANLPCPDNCSCYDCSYKYTDSTYYLKLLCVEIEFNCWYNEKISEYHSVLEFCGCVYDEYFVSKNCSETKYLEYANKRETEEAKKQFTQGRIYNELQ